MATMNKSTNGTVAVIGLGPAGVAAVKNLLEAGFDVVGFDQTDRIGGLWQWSADPAITTVLKSTVANISKQRNSYQDFPFPNDVPTHPPAADIAQYIEDYADHFKLRKHFRLGCRISRVERSGDDRRWSLTLADGSSKASTEEFDKVVVTTGPYHNGFVPKVEGVELFQGSVMHARAFKDPNDFAKKRVVVVGLSNTGGDISVALGGIASEVYCSFRSGARIINRPPPGQLPTEVKISRRITLLGQSMNNALPWLASRLGSFVLERKMLKDNPFIRPEWKILPAGPLLNSTPIVNDHILNCFRDGKVTPKPGLRRLLAPRSVEFVDGTVAENVDAIIFATGYQSDYSILSTEADPTAFPTREWDASTHSNGLLYPRLYQGIFSTTYPTSLAFVGPFRGHSFAIFNNTDLSTTAIAQVFAGNYRLPSKKVMDAWCDRNYASNLEQIRKWRIAKVGIDPKGLERFLNEASGNQVNEKLGWGLEGWKFWFQDHSLYRLLVDGVDTPYLYRLFESPHGLTGRKQWDGARLAIEKANADVREQPKSQ